MSPSIYLFLFVVSVSVCFGNPDVQDYYSDSDIQFDEEPESEVPIDPVLTLEPNNGPFVEGDRINASCKVIGAWPDFKVNLYIGSEIFRGRDSFLRENNDVVVIRDFILSSADDQKIITCVARHIIRWKKENSVRYASRVISVQNAKESQAKGSTAVLLCAGAALLVIGGVVV